MEFELPDLGEGVAEGEVLAWHVDPGDRVTEDQVLAEVETDKAAVDVPSPVDGVVAERHAEVGEIITVGSVLVTIDETGEDGTAATEDPEPADEGGEAGTDGATTAAGGRVFASPSVRQLAREEGVDITTVDGSGPGGRITESDVRAAAEDSDDGPTSAVSKVGDDGDDEPKSAVSKVGDSDDEDEPAVQSAVRSAGTDERREGTLATPATRRVARELDVDIDAVPTDEARDGKPYVDEAAVRAFAEQGAAAVDQESEPEPEPAGGASEAVTPTPPTEAPGDRREPYRGIRRRIGEQMSQSRREVPHATHHDTAVVEGLVAARDRLQATAEAEDVRLTYTPILLRCVAAALEQHPILNTQLDAEREEIVYKDAVNLGVAAATDRGLVVPVVERVGEKGLLELAREVNGLVDRARAGDLEPAEMQGGTFTVTNFGAIGGEYANPVINVPETAILGVGELTERPVVEDGTVVARPTLPLSLAIDHRVVDGADAARFTNTVMEYLADPTRLLL